MAIRHENIELEMSDSCAAESRNEDLNSSDYGDPLTTSSKQPMHKNSYEKPRKSLRSPWNIESTMASVTLFDVGIVTPQDSSKIIDKSRIRHA